MSGIHQHKPEATFTLKHLFGMTAVVCSGLAVFAWLRNEQPHRVKGLRHHWGCCGHACDDRVAPSGDRQRIYISGPPAIAGRHQTSGEVCDADFIRLIRNFKLK